MGELYKLDFSNGKSYIGITTKTSAKRFNGHKNRCFSCKGSSTILYNAWRRHGDPKLIVLAVLENEDLAETEIKAIKIFGTKFPNGYNSTDGGDTSPLSDPNVALKFKGNKFALGSKHERSQEYRQKLAAALKGNKNSVGNNHGIGNKNASGKRSADSIANIKAGIAAAKLGRIS